jgi:hypothetical protein
MWAANNNQTETAQLLIENSNINIGSASNIISIFSKSNNKATLNDNNSYKSPTP